MSARFEIVQEQNGKFHFQLHESSGRVLLRGLDCNGKIEAQTEVLHARSALQDDTLLVEHKAHDGTCFLVVKDRDGSVLARSYHVDNAAGLPELLQTIRQAAAMAPLVDLSKRRHSVEH